MEWVCSDGTVVRLRGRVEGTGPLARTLRDQLEMLPYGRAADVQLSPPPGGSVTLDPDNPYHVDAWVRQWLRSPRLRSITLERAPKLPPIPPNYDAHDTEPHIY